MIVVIVLALDLDPNFLAFFHIIRLLMILFTVTIILKLIKKLIQNTRYSFKHFFST